MDAEPVPKILKEETIKAITTQKTNKTPGSDQITNELLKSTAPVIAPILTDLFNEILETETIPEDWTKSTIVLLHKKGSKEEIDDLILFSECPRKLQLMIQQLSDQSAKAGLSMNISKTKAMTNSSKTHEIIVNMQKIEYVNEYIYLGQLISPNKTMDKEIDRRIANTWKRYWSLSEVMKDRDMPMKAKRKVYNTCILPCLTYGTFCI
ncbi:uncharacterized protein LOC121737438 [Aricia agestis]|uniref:uncharacterized protein LOC121737438 n=1 Tax=Aricia agestis TaxID=91739 RepID=UPI001C204BE3|nr:uncharacterized protein LOC121737438 [Aricia agestis]